MPWKNKLKEIEKRNKTSFLDKKRMQELAGVKPNISPNVLKFEEDLKGFIENLKNTKSNDIHENEEEESGEFSKLLNRIKNAKTIIQNSWPEGYEYWESLFNNNLNALFQEGLSEEEEQYIMDVITEHLNQLEDFYQTKF